jgi:hypothetical protein
MLYAFIDPRRQSLSRSTFLVLASLFAALIMAGWPAEFHARASLKLAIPVLIALVGFADTFRCLRDHWDFYHGAVVLTLFTDVLAISMILFLFLYPYGKWIM